MRLPDPEKAFLLSLSVLFLFILLYHYELPGLYYDEADKAVPLLQMMQGVDNVNGSPVKILGRETMIVFAPYIGPGLTYSLLPAFLLFGPGVFAIRLTGALFALGTVIFLYLTARKFVSRDAASMATLLVALSPVFVMLQMQAFYNYGPVTFFCATTLYSLLQYRGKREAKWLYASGLLAGMGISVAIQFIWFLAGLAILSALDLFSRRKIERHLLVALFLLLSMASPLVLYNLKTGGIFKMVGVDSGMTSSYGVSNLDYFGNLGKRFSELSEVFDGGLAAIPTDILHFDSVFTPFFCGALACTVAAAVWGRRKPIREIAGIALCVFLSTFLLSAFTVTGLSPYHLVIMYPAVMLVLAAGLEFACGLSQYSRHLVLAVFAIALLSSLYVTLQYKADVVVFGGVRNNSDAIYQLADYLVSNNEYKPVAMDWGFYNNLYIITKGEVDAPNSFGWSDEPGAEFNASIRGMLNDSRMIYLFHTNYSEQFNRSSAFGDVARGMNKTLIVDEVFYQRDGNEIYVLYRTI